MTLDTLLTILGSNVVVAVFSYMTGKRKTSAETDNIILDGLEKSINVYRSIIDDLKEQIEALNSKVGILEAKIEELIKENHELKGFGKRL
jgi:predicted RNase H-like nuclease (RuvC/YqgF family)